MEWCLEGLCVDLFNFILCSIILFLSCEIPIEIQKKHFWLFEFFVTIFLIVSTSVVIKRKQFLDKKATERVRKQLINEN